MRLLLLPRGTPRCHMMKHMAESLDKNVGRQPMDQLSKRERKAEFERLEERLRLFKVSWEELKEALPNWENLEYSDSHCVDEDWDLATRIDIPTLLDGNMTVEQHARLQAMLAEIQPYRARMRELRFPLPPKTAGPPPPGAPPITDPYVNEAEHSP
mgnify:CR=1 FL=1